MVDLLFSIELGIVAGFLPVYLGLVPALFLRRVSGAWRSLLVSFSTGVLLFLFVDVTSTALTLAKSFGANAILLGAGLVLGLFSPAVLADRTLGAGRSKKMSRKIFTAFVVASAIGIHNFGEGLALGSAYAAGAVGLTFILVLGFALHNGTEGMAIVGPVASEPIQRRQSITMGFLAGFPTIVGSLTGALLYSNAIGTLFFAIASGALLYVIFELVAMVHAEERAKRLFTGIVIGFVFMYLTDLLLTI